MIHLFNGNCIEVMKQDSFKELIKNKKAVIITDPPFNVNYHYNSYKDNLKESEYYDFLKQVFKMYDLPYIVIHYPESLYKLTLATNEAPLKVVSWVYNSNNAKQHRDIAFYGIEPDFNKEKQPYKNLNDKRIQEKMKNGSGGGRLYDWWEINQVKNVSKEKITHPCMMPLEVMKRIIKIIPDDYIVIDTFMGSGTTAIACKILKRDFIGIEIDKDYYDMAQERIKGTLIQTSFFEDREILTIR